MLREFSSWWPYDILASEHSIRVFEPIHLLQTEVWKSKNHYRLCIHYFDRKYFLYPDWTITNG